MLCTLGVSGACSSEPRPPSLVGSGAQPSPEEGGGSTSSAGDAGSAGLSAAGEGDDGASGAAGESGGPATAFGGGAGTVPSVRPSCDPRATWSAAASVSKVSSTAAEVLLALTPDELDLAFLRDGALFVAHRPDALAPFSSGDAVSIPAGWTAAHGASLSADGRRLVLVSDPDQKKLGELTRSSRGNAFSAIIDTSAFLAINQDSDFTRRVYASPVVSAGDDQLFFNSSLDAYSTIVVSSRTAAGSFGAPKTLSAAVFDGNDGKRRLPTGVSADGLTLFYFNEESAEEEARWRATSSVDSPLYDMLSLGGRRAATPNSACDRLYSTSSGDVVVEQD
ncbi:MAG TPA: hypothetical protein VER12_03465 [Polyangiaceae bacterium]|nr:hypothetical protein [Polyangiaceae bacterium]